MNAERESMEVDVLIVGAGPAGLSAAIRLKQLDANLSVCVLEKGAEVGSHILSGNAFDPRALTELIPDWQAQGAPLDVPVTQDTFLYFTEKKSYRLPTPAPMKNEGNYVISLGNLCRWLAQYAENLGVDIFPGFAASEVLFDERDHVIGVATGDMGVDKNGKATENYQAGMALHAKMTLFGEGCHGSLSQLLIEKYNLRQDANPQSYGIGVKELWEVKSPLYQAGSVMHSCGWPLDKQTYGGGFVYQLDKQRVYVGLVVGLDYQNPYLSPFEEMQRFKTHSAIRPLLEGGQRLCYGARAITEGGLQSLPKLTFPGGALVGDSAGFLNVPRIKGSHTAMKSGMLAADSVVEAFKKQDKEASQYQSAFKASWLHDELNKARNIRPGFHWGLWPGLVYAAFDTYLFRGKAPWTFRYTADHLSLKPAKDMPKIAYPKADDVLTFDRLSSVYLSNTHHTENQPCHLHLKDTQVPQTINFPIYDAPETRYCPAGVYEMVYNETQEPSLQINAQNCIHCKTCDIKDPTQNILWRTPEGGGGPNYTAM